MTAGYEAPTSEASMMSRGEPLPGLSGSHLSIPNGSGDNTGPKFLSLDFKSGASYEGGLDNGKKCGTGRFAWPNGAWFEGEYMNDMRQGKGIQHWADGSNFEGDFLNDMRHGRGVHTWPNGERYTGMYFKDRRHGQGEYTWPDGTSYVGLFYMEKKEGYGTFKFPDGRIFKGLYKDDEREGPGTLIYPDKHQDIGLWQRENLIRLCNVVPGMFTMKDHPEFDYDATKVIPTNDNISMTSEISLVSSHVTKPQEEIRSQVTFNETTSAVFYSSLHSLSLALDVKSFDEAFAQEVASISSINIKKPAEQLTKREKSSGRVQSPRRERSAGRVVSPMRERSASRVKSPMRNQSARSIKSPTLDRGDSVLSLYWNVTPSCLSMQAHISKHAPIQHRAGFRVEQVLKGDRKGFGEKGPLEIASEKFLEAAKNGDLDLVKDMLHAGKVHVDVADINGNTALITAAINWHIDTINCLLDNGANINKLSNEGISALAACHVAFYPPETFKYNIAERYLERPSDFVTEPGYDVNEAAKGVAGLSARRPTAPIEKKSLRINSKKIQRFRNTYSVKKHASAADKENATNLISLDIHSQTENICSAGSTATDTDRKLGTLQVKRASKTDAEEPQRHRSMARTQRISDSSPDTEGDSLSSRSSVQSKTDTSEFDSNYSVKNYPIEVSERLIERCATQLSTNNMVVGRNRSLGDNPVSIGTARMLAQDKSKHQLMEATIRLLLHRGADPNASSVPMPVLFFATKAADVEAVRLLLLKGASTATKLPEEKGGLTPLHIAAAIPGEEGVNITQLLLDSLADPDERATEDDSFLNTSLHEEWKKDAIDKECLQLLGGRTPLQIACARDDNYKSACKVVHLLLSHHASSRLLCNGQSPLTLAIQSGNDLAVEELLGHGVDVSQKLSHGVGSALCVASSTEFEHRRTPEARIRLIDKLMRGRADILAPIAIGNKRVRGTCVDYAYHMYNLDRRIAHMPYHALSPAERETFNARRLLLSHLGELLRNSAVAKEKERMNEERQQGRMSRSPSPSFRYTGAGAPLPPGTKRRGKMMDSSTALDSSDNLNQKSVPSIRKPLLRYCYDCGRSVGVKLLPCTRCKEVFYCSKACKLKAWNARHKDECVRVGGRSTSARSKKDRRIDSPTPACDPDQGKPTTVSGIMARDSRIKFPIISDAHNLFLNGDLPAELARLQAYSEVNPEEVPATNDHDVRMAENVVPEGRQNRWIAKVPVKGRSKSAKQKLKGLPKFLATYEEREMKKAVLKYLPYKDNYSYE